MAGHHYPVVIDEARVHAPIADIQSHRHLRTAALCGHRALLSVDAVVSHATFQEAALLSSSHSVCFRSWSIDSRSRRTLRSDALNDGSKWSAMGDLAMLQTEADETESTRSRFQGDQ